MSSRRSFLTGLLAAPMVVAAQKLAFGVPRDRTLRLINQSIIISQPIIVGHGGMIQNCTFTASADFVGKAMISVEGDNSVIQGVTCKGTWGDNYAVIATGRFGLIRDLTVL